MTPTHYLRNGDVGPSRAKCGYKLEAHADPKRWLPWTTDWNEVTCGNCKPKEAQDKKPRVRIDELVTGENLAIYAASPDKLLFAMSLVDEEFGEDSWTERQIEYWRKDDDRERMACILDQKMWKLSRAWTQVL